MRGSYAKEKRHQQRVCRKTAKAHTGLEGVHFSTNQNEKTLYYIGQWLESSERYHLRSGVKLALEWRAAMHPALTELKSKPQDNPTDSNELHARTKSNTI